LKEERSICDGLNPLLFEEDALRPLSGETESISTLYGFSIKQGASSFQVLPLVDNSTTPPAYNKQQHPVQPSLKGFYKKTRITA
jgi:hypothetical protein